jgi:hypothetical protein
MDTTKYVPRAGDVVEVGVHHVGDVKRVAEILEVIGGEAGRQHYRVRWEDGHESVLFPGDDASFRRRGRGTG